MKKSLLQFSICILMGVILLLAGSATVAKTADVEADVAAIKEIWNQYTLGANTGDLDLWISLWDDNGIRMAPGTPAVFEKEQIRASGYQDFVEVSKKKDLHRGSCVHFLETRQSIDLGKIEVYLSRDSYQASCGIEGFLSKGG